MHDWARRRAGLLIRLASLLLVMVHAFHTGPVQADAYLDALNAEALGGETGPTTKKPAYSTSEVRVGSAQELPEGLDEAGLEHALRRRFPGSYVFYSRLGPEGRKAVYEVYSENHDIEQVKSAINDQLIR